MGRVLPARGGRRGRHHPARPAEDERAQRAGPGGDPGRGHRGRRARRRPGRRRVRRRAGLRRRRRHQGDERHVLHGHGQALRRAPVGVHRGRADPQARRRRDHRLRPRRRLRARAVRRRPVRRRRRRARPARDPARHHPGRRRHPAADPAGRPEQGQGPRSSPAASSRPTRRWPSAWSTGWSPPRPVYDEAVAWAGQFAGAAAYALRAAKETHRPRPRGRPRDRPGDRAPAVRGAVRHRGPHHRHAILRRERPRQGQSSRAGDERRLRKADMADKDKKDAGKKDAARSRMSHPASPRWCGCCAWWPRCSWRWARCCIALDVNQDNALVEVRPQRRRRRRPGRLLARRRHQAVQRRATPRPRTPCSTGGSARSPTSIVGRILERVDPLLMSPWPSGPCDAAAVRDPHRGRVPPPGFPLVASRTYIRLHRRGRNRPHTMNIVVCVKYVPDATADRQFESDNTVDRVGVDGLLSELDEYAVEQALQIKEKADADDDHGDRAVRRAREGRRRGPQGAADGRRPGRPRRRRRDRRLGRRSPPRWCWPRRSRSSAPRRRSTWWSCGMASTDGAMSVVPAMLAERLGLPAGDAGLGRRDPGRPGPDQARRRHRDRGDRRHHAAGALGDRPVRRGPLPVVQGDHGGEEEAAGDLVAVRPRRRRRPGRPVGAAWTEVEETTARPPRTAGEIVTDEDGSGATALAEFLASKKFI